MRAPAFFLSVLSGLAIAGASFASDVVVQPGDSWYSIATSHNLSLSVLRELNPGTPTTLQPGMSLNLPDGARYVMRSGDSLGEVAEAHGVTLGALMGANNLSDTTVNVGKMLRIPDATTPNMYEVQQGDTLYRLSLAFGVPVDRLVYLNDLEGDVIHPGDEIIISGDPKPSQRDPMVERVKPGDTLWSIAQRNDVPVDEIMAANDLGNVMLTPGMALTIPGRYARSHTNIGGIAERHITVQPGDTLTTIARRHGSSVAALMSANNLHDSRIRVGQRLAIVGDQDLPPAAFRTHGNLATLTWPARGKITSRFGYRTLPGVGSNLHNGVDIDMDTGDPVVAAASGVVTVAGQFGGLGNAVIVESGGVEYRYGHNSRVLVNVGDHVRPGQRIALAGNTGFSFGSHLHFEIREDGKPIDPLPLLAAN